jgi:hypothetical protein
VIGGGHIVGSLLPLLLLLGPWFMYTSLACSGHCHCCCCWCYCCWWAPGLCVLVLPPLPPHLHWPSFSPTGSHASFPVLAVISTGVCLWLALCSGSMPICTCLYPAISAGICLQPAPCSYPMPVHACFNLSTVIHTQMEQSVLVHAHWHRLGSPKGEVMM